jgi:hypothetical protein
MILQYQVLQFLYHTRRGLFHDEHAACNHAIEQSSGSTVAVCAVESAAATENGKYVALYINGQKFVPEVENGE